jgi:hypothetical protein
VKVLNRLSLGRIEKAEKTGWERQIFLVLNNVSSPIINDEYCFPFYLFNILWLEGKTYISCARWDVKWGWEDAKV